MISHEDVRNRIRALELRLEREKRTNNQQRAEIQRLRGAVMTLLPDGDQGSGLLAHEGNSVDDPDNDEDCEVISVDGTASDGEIEIESSSASGLPYALWDDSDQVYRCRECDGEVIERSCHNCSAEHQYPDQNEEDTTLYQSVTTDDEALRSERRLVPRGTTPLLQISPISDFSIPLLYRDHCYPRREEYKALLERGATRLMCETFCLEYKSDTGIIAWADHDLFEAFSGPGMKDGDTWKIYLGRCITLEDEDIDGAQFIEDLLDEVLYYPIKPPLGLRTSERWHTISEGPGIWATKPMRSSEEETHEEMDLGSDASDCDSEDRLQANDAALEVAMYDDAPAIRPNDYELPAVVDGADSEDEDEDEVMGPALGFFGQEADSAFDPDDVPDNDYEVSDDGVVVKVVDTMDSLRPKSCDKYAEDSADSDFDSDEELSGDEWVSHVQYNDRLSGLQLLC